MSYENLCYQILTVICRSYVHCIPPHIASPVLHPPHLYLFSIYFFWGSNRDDSQPVNKSMQPTRALLILKWDVPWNVSWGHCPKNYAIKSSPSFVGQASISSPTYSLSYSPPPTAVFVPLRFFWGTNMCFALSIDTFFYQPVRLFRRPRRDSNPQPSDPMLGFWAL